MNGNQYGQGGFQYPQQQGMGFQSRFPPLQRRQGEWYNFQDGDNWVQLLSLQERQFQTRFGSQKFARDVLVNGQKFTASLPKTANQQLQQALQTIMATGKNPLEFNYNIRRNRVGVEPRDVEYQVVTGEWVGLPTIQPNAYSQPIRTQAVQSPAPQIFQQGQIGGSTYPQNAQQTLVPYTEFRQISTIPQQVVSNPFQPKKVPEMAQNQPLMQSVSENAIVLTEQEKTLLEMAEQSPEKLEKVDFINKWVLAMRTQFNEPNYPIQRADIVFNQFYH